MPSTQPLPGPTAEGKAILVTGGTSGIGLALCRQLASDYGCRVFVGARNSVKGGEVASSAGGRGSLEAVTLEVTSDRSVRAATDTVRRALGSQRLYALVNNAGVHPRSGLDDDEVVDVNFAGARRVFEAFQPLLDPKEGRVVNIGSDLGPMFVQSCPTEVQKVLCNGPDNLSQLEDIMLGECGLGSNYVDSYGLSKALLASYTMLTARQHPNLTFSCCSPGFIDTNLTAGWGGAKGSPEEGSQVIRHCLFEELGGNGWYYIRDGVRSQYHYTRRPGEPEYDGQPPF